MFFLYIYLVFCLGIIVYQDFKYLSISVKAAIFSISSIFITGIVFLYLSLGWKQAAIVFFTNVGFLIILFLGITLMVWLRKRNKEKIINQYLGTGDVLLIVSLCGFFSPFNFRFFLIAAILITLIINRVYKLMLKLTYKEIPFAGYLAALLMVVLFAKVIYPELNLYDDYWLYKRLYK